MEHIAKKIIQNIKFITRNKLFNVPYSMLCEKTGFTLIETLLSVAIIGISFTAVLFSLNQFSKLDRTVNEKSMAIYLAQEGVEIVRNVRDTNRLRDNDWDDGIDSESYVPVLEAGELELSEIEGGETWKNKIYYDPDNSDGDEFFGYRQSKVETPPVSWEETTFYREIEIDKNYSDGETPLGDLFQIKAKVWYGKQSSESAVIVEGFLYNWR